MPSWILIGGHPTLVMEDDHEVMDLVNHAEKHGERWVELHAPAEEGWWNVNVRASAVFGVMER